MKITIFLALTLAAIYMAQAEPLFEEDAQGHHLKQDSGINLQDQRRLKRATCSIERCSAICGTRGKMSVCHKGRCKCY